METNPFWLDALLLLVVLLVYIVLPAIAGWLLGGGWYYTQLDGRVKDTYRYFVISEGKIVDVGITYDLSRRILTLWQKDRTHLKPTGKPVTWEEGLNWEKRMKVQSNG